MRVSIYTGCDIRPPLISASVPRRTLTVLEKVSSSGRLFGVVRKRNYVIYRGPFRGKRLQSIIGEQNILATRWEMSYRDKIVNRIAVY